MPAESHSARLLTPLTPLTPRTPVCAAAACARACSPSQAAGKRALRLRAARLVRMATCVSRPTAFELPRGLDLVCEVTGSKDTAVGQKWRRIGPEKPTVGIELKYRIAGEVRCSTLTLTQAEARGHDHITC